MALNQITPLVGIPLSQIWGPLVSLLLGEGESKASPFARNSRASGPGSARPPGVVARIVTARAAVQTKDAAAP